jgi:hypothetical protein
VDTAEICVDGGDNRFWKWDNAATIFNHKFAFNPFTAVSTDRQEQDFP